MRSGFMPRGYSHWRRRALPTESLCELGCRPHGLLCVHGVRFVCVAEQNTDGERGPPELDLEGRYRLEAEIGRGGLGIVYRATHRGLDRAVAIKLLHEHYGANEVLRARFDREAKALAALEHPNIVAVTDYGIAGSTPYLVMELLEGATLAQRLAGGALEPEAACSLTRALLAALAFAHARGLLHRDVKPGNIFLQRVPDGSERVKLLDFGLAKFTTRPSTADDPTLTRTGDVMGTPAYMSPEQIGGDPLDARTDVYAVGVILFQMLAGRLPFEGEAADQLRGHLVEPPPTLAQACPQRIACRELEALLQRALNKRLARRFADAGEMLEALESLPLPWLLTQGKAPATGSEPLAFAPTCVAPAVVGAATPQRRERPSAAERGEPFTWIRRIMGALFLAGARLIALVAFVVIVIALLAIYLAQRHEVRPSDLKRLREDIAPRLGALQNAAERLARGGAVQEDSASKPHTTNPGAAGAAAPADEPTRGLSGP